MPSRPLQLAELVLLDQEPHDLRERLPQHGSLVLAGAAHLLQKPGRRQRSRLVQPRRRQLRRVHRRHALQRGCWRRSETLPGLMLLQLHVLHRHLPPVLRRHDAAEVCRRPVRPTSAATAALAAQLAAAAAESSAEGLAAARGSVGRPELGQAMRVGALVVGAHACDELGASLRLHEVWPRLELAVLVRISTLLLVAAEPAQKVLAKTGLH
mmetsp:Transcript_33954/g.97522  ORF Transcript_33954/g.97522 Transcript_33954/m.97522 type:complete len:211 (+) Transcript_33954:378-1010(+)